MNSLLALVLGVSLAASCGFRVFAPMLIMSIAAMTGRLELAEGWHWIGSLPALMVFAVATATEICGYYIPWVDNALDMVASPAAVVAGIVVTAACVSGMDPLLQWSLVLIGGGGIAGLVQGGTVLVRGASSTTTGGLGNPIVATFEAIMSIVLPILAVVVPMLALVILCGLFAIGFVIARRVLRRISKGITTPVGVNEVASP